MAEREERVGIDQVTACLKILDIITCMLLIILMILVMIFMMLLMDLLQFFMRADHQVADRVQRSLSKEKQVVEEFKHRMKVDLMMVDHYWWWW